MIAPAKGNRFGRLIREARERAGLLQEDVARALGVDRSLISQWERGEAKRPINTDDVNRLAKLLPVSVLEMVSALGYEVEIPGFEGEDEVTLLEAYRRAAPDLQQAVRRVLGLPTRSSLRPGAASEPLRRIANRPDRRREEE